MRTLETRYATALFELSQDEDGLRAGTALLTGNPALWRALTNPCVAAGEKDRVLRRLLSGQVSGPVLSFFRLLCRRERLSLLPAIVERYHLLKLKAEGGALAVYRCARQPAPADLARIEAFFKARRGFSKVEFKVVLDPSLLGGFILQLDGVTYDKSVRGMLRGLRRSLKERE